MTLSNGQTHTVFRKGQFYNNWAIVNTRNTSDGIMTLQGSQWANSDLNPQELFRFAVVGDSAQSTNGFSYLTMKVFFNTAGISSIPVYVCLHSSANYEANETTLQGYEVV